MFGLSDDFPMKLEIEAGMNPQMCPPVSVGFGLNAVIDDAKTKKEGHEVYRDVEFVKIAIPGDRLSLFFQPATDAHKKRFPQAWKDYQSRTAEKPREGLPLEHWAPISKASALNLKTLHIHTVEDLAAVHEGHVTSIGPQGRVLRQQAIDFLAQAKGSAVVTQQAAEKKAMQDQITALQNQIAALQQGNVAKPGAPPPGLVQVALKQALEHDDVEADVVAAARRPRKGQ